MIDYDKTKKDDLSVIAQITSLGNITESSLYKRLAQVKKEINSFKEKNKKAADMGGVKEQARDVDQNINPERVNGYNGGMYNVTVSVFNQENIQSYE